MRFDFPRLKGEIFVKLKKALCAVLVFCLVAAFGGCGKKSETAAEIKDDFFLDVKMGKTVYTEYSDGELIAQTTANDLVLSSEHQAKYPTLQKTLEKRNEDTINTAREYAGELADMAVDSMEYTDYISSYEWERSIKVIRADKHILSYEEKDLEYTGGAHPNGGIGGVNFDPQTGNKLKLSDIMVDVKDITRKVATLLNEKYGDALYDDAYTLIKDYDVESLNWVVDYHGITFFFSPYELAPYGAGLLEVNILFSENPQLFNEKYTKFPENGYFRPIVLYDEYEIDLVPNDDKVDTVAAFMDWSDDGSDIKSLIVYVNDQEHKFKKIRGYDFEIYYGEQGGNHYLLVCTFEENGYSSTHLLKIDSTNVNLLYTKEGHGAHWEGGEFYSEGYTIYRHVITNPGKMLLEKRIDILGTRMAWANFSVNFEKGIIEQADADYSIEDDTPLTALINIKAIKISDKKPCEIVEGTAVYPYRTDCKTYVDVKDGSGNVYRIEINCDDYTVKINGKPETECFSDIMYAG